MGVSPIPPGQGQGGDRKPVNNVKHVGKGKRTTIRKPQASQTPHVPSPSGISSASRQSSSVEGVALQVLHLINEGSCFPPFLTLLGKSRCL